MATYILRRTLQAIPILFGVALVSFAIIQLAPGSPIDRFRTPSVRPETLENLIRLYGLDKPVHERDDAGGVGEDLVPFAKWFVRGQHGGSLLVAPRDHLEQQIRVACVVGEISDLIDA